MDHVDAGELPVADVRADVGVRRQRRACYASTMIEARIRASVDAFVAAWNEHDGGVRMRLLESACTDDVVMRTGGRRTNGRAELDARMADFQKRQPDKRAVFASRVDVQGYAFRYIGMAEDPTGARSGEAFDAGECDEDGRIRFVISFVGAALPLR